MNGVLPPPRESLLPVKNFFLVALDFFTENKFINVVPLNFSSDLNQKITLSFRMKQSNFSILLESGEINLLISERSNTANTPLFPNWV